MVWNSSLRSQCLGSDLVTLHQEVHEKKGIWNLDASHSNKYFRLLSCRKKWKTLLDNTHVVLF